MIDIHCHILHNLDDGPDNIEKSIALIEEEIKQGVTDIVFTPHFSKGKLNAEMKDTAQKFDEINEIVKTKGLNINLYLGNEVYYGQNFFDMVDEKKFFMLADTKYMLIELSPIKKTDNVHEVCYELKLRGYLPIIAHVERYSYMFENMEILEKLMEEGAYFQINASNVLGYEGKNNMHNAEILLSHGVVSFVASDAHDTEERNVYMQEAYDKIVQKYGDDYAELIFDINQKSLLAGEIIKTPIAELVKKKHSIIETIKTKIRDM